MSFATRTWGGRSTMMTNTSSATTTARNPANQAALDRLQQRLDNAKADHYHIAYSRAMDSLARSTEWIATYEQAMKLKHVGQHCASIICPPNHEDKATKVTRKTKKKGKKKQGQESDSDEEESSPPPARATKKKQSTKSNTTNNMGTAKELAYQSARQQAIQNWTHPIPCQSRSDQAHGLQWKVLLLVDGREPKCRHILQKCAASQIPAEERTLPIGDMTWIAQGLRRDPSLGTTVVEVELLLGTLIERKSTADLVASFCETRYNEQRLRLQQSGQPQILFLIEGDIQREVHPNFPKERMQMAIIETRVNLDFQIIHTDHMQHTIQTLKRLHKRIVQRSFPQTYTARPEQRRHNNSLLELVMDQPPTPALGQARFQTYDELKTKIERDREAGTRTVGALHAAMLRQANCGMKLIQAIRQDYPTPSALLKAYEAVDDNVQYQEDLIKDCGPVAGSTRKVGPKVSKEVQMAYCTTVAESSQDNPTDRPSAAAAKKPAAAHPTRKKSTSHKAAATAMGTNKDKSQSNGTSSAAATNQKKRPSPSPAAAAANSQNNDVDALWAQRLEIANKRLKRFEQNAAPNHLSAGSAKPASPTASAAIDLLSDDDDDKGNGNPAAKEEPNPNAAPVLVQPKSKEVVLLEDSDEEDLNGPVKMKRDDKVASSVAAAASVSGDTADDAIEID